MRRQGWQGLPQHNQREARSSRGNGAGPSDPPRKKGVGVPLYCASSLFWFWLKMREQLFRYVYTHTQREREVSATGYPLLRQRKCELPLKFTACLTAVPYFNTCKFRRVLGNGRKQRKPKNQEPGQAAAGGGGCFGSIKW